MCMILFFCLEQICLEILSRVIDKPIYVQFFLLHKEIGSYLQRFSQFIRISRPIFARSHRIYLQMKAVFRLYVLLEPVQNQVKLAKPLQIIFNLYVSSDICLFKSGGVRGCSFFLCSCVLCEQVYVNEEDNEVACFFRAFFVGY